MAQHLLELPLPFTGPRQKRNRLVDELRTFKEFGQRTSEVQTVIEIAGGETLSIPTFVNEFWTSRQRQASSLQEISYRACFKPQLPRFFIERFTEPADAVYDPFMGRGTTCIEAALLGRVPVGCDINPLSVVLTRPRITPPPLDEIEARIRRIDFWTTKETDEDFLIFYHPETLTQIASLKRYLLETEAKGRLDSVDDWIRLVALNRLTGHSRGFFSVYTMPPNQAVSVKSQRKINERRRQVPPLRKVPDIILKKSRQLLADCDYPTRRMLAGVAAGAKLITGDASKTPKIASDSISLVVTSPPFLDVVDYATDNWLRCWFLGLDAKSVKLTVPKRLEDWQAAMTGVFHELHRVLKPGGHVAFEVGEVRKGTLRLEEAVVPCGIAAGLNPRLILINAQKFTKTANCWGVDNNTLGTNTNRIVVFQKG
jgi:hypothetical protein